MSPRAIAVHAAIAAATWLFPFLTGCAVSASATHTDETGTTTTTAKAALTAGRGPDAGIARTSTKPSPVHLRYVTHRDRKASDFKRVAEYFTGKPENGDDVVLPLDPASRDGHWFTFAIGLTESLPAGTSAVLEIVRSDKSGPQTHTVKLPHKPESALTREYHIGLTGKEALAKDAKITAWRFSLRDFSGKTLAAEQSFLWELPVEKK